MCPTVRIDDDVYDWLKSQAEPFEDTPNSVLRRIANLDGSAASVTRSASGNGKHSKSRRSPLASGNELLKTWDIAAVQARFHRDGTFFERPARYPAALCDQKGYVVFETEDALEKEPNVSTGAEKVNVHTGISSLPGYVIAPAPIR